MTEYTIASIPTVYRGREYRSRLEARWAAFFHRLGWTHEYEPFDLGAWSPDFLLYAGQGAELLVEIKPIDEFDQDVWAKVVDGASTQLGHAGNPESDPLITVLLTRLAPQNIEGEPVDIGWFGFSWDGFNPRAAKIAWVMREERPSFDAHVVSIEGTRLQFACGDVQPFFVPGGQFSFMPQSYNEHTMKLWGDATSEVQWRPRP